MSGFSNQKHIVFRGLCGFHFEIDFPSPHRTCDTASLSVGFIKTLGPVLAFMGPCGFGIGFAMLLWLGVGS